MTNSSWCLPSAAARISSISVAIDFCRRQRWGSSHPGNDLGHEAIDLGFLGCGVAAAIAHDDPVEAQLEQPLEVVDDLSERAGAGLAPIEGAAFGFADADEHL